MVDKYYFIKGGAERYYFEVEKLLREKGHFVIPFSVNNDRNMPTSYQKYFLSDISFNDLTLTSKLKQAKNIIERIIYSKEAIYKIEKLINDEKPDIAHLHMIDHQISPSILPVLKKFSIPVVQTVHQYKLVCPNYRLYNMRTGEICERCLTGKYYHPIFQKCHKDSSLAGVLLFLEMTIHKSLKIYESNVDIFHCPSQFMMKKLAEGGVPKNKLRKLYYTINLFHYPYTPQYSNYIVYYGRLAKEKGIVTLLNAMRELKNVSLYIIGEGPQRQLLEELKDRYQLKNVSFLGIKQGEELKRIVANSKFVVVPSEWYDNSPLVIYESFAFGKPVIGADIGGISELIDHGTNGFLFPPKDHRVLSDYIRELWDSEKKVREYGRNAREKAEKEFCFECHYEKLLQIYREAGVRVNS